MLRNILIYGVLNIQDWVAAGAVRRPAKDNHTNLQTNRSRSKDYDICANFTTCGHNIHAFLQHDYTFNMRITIR